MITPERLTDTLLNECVPESEIEKLLSVYGGLPLYVPKNVTDNHHLVRECGMHITSVLSSIYGGEQLVIPTGAEFRRKKVYRRVLDLRLAGWNNRQIAQECKIHLRQVYRVFAGYEPELTPAEDTRQQSLPF